MVTKAIRLENSFLAVQDSSIGDLVTHSLTKSDFGFLQRVALDFHTASSFSLVVQEDCRNDLEGKRSQWREANRLNFLLGWEKIKK